jgi:predicted TPR repeat methyltransferase
MLARARRRKIYRTLERADFETALAGGGADYDLVLAADAFVYIGDLAPTFEGVARRMGPDGSFLFTVEKSGTAAYELGPKRRWRHSESYLRELAEKSGFEIAGFVAATPRFEQNVPVEGFAVALSHRG